MLDRRGLFKGLFGLAVGVPLSRLMGTTAVAPVLYISERYQSFTELVTATLRAQPQAMADNLMQHNALFSRLKEHGRIMPLGATTCRSDTQPNIDV